LLYLLDKAQTWGQEKNDLDMRKGVNTPNKANWIYRFLLRRFNPV
jgi:hypothetical protein